VFNIDVLDPVLLVVVLKSKHEFFPMQCSIFVPVIFILHKSLDPLLPGSLMI